MKDPPPESAHRENRSHEEQRAEEKADCPQRLHLLKCQSVHIRIYINEQRSAYWLRATSYSKNSVQRERYDIDKKAAGQNFARAVKRLE